VREQESEGTRESESECEVENDGKSLEEYLLGLCTSLNSPFHAQKLLFGVQESSIIQTLEVRPIFTAKMKGCWCQRLGISPNKVSSSSFLSLAISIYCVVEGREECENGEWGMGEWIMRECGNVGMWECGNVGLRDCGIAGMWECGNVGMRECGNAEMRECGNAGMRECGNAGVQECRNAGRGCRTRMQDENAGRECRTGMQDGNAGRECRTGIQDANTGRECRTGMRTGTHDGNAVFFTECTLSRGEERGKRGEKRGGRE
jgi:hypothetical protein